MPDLPTIDEIMAEAKALRQGLPLAMSKITPEEIREELSKRERFANRVKDYRRIQRKMVKAFEQDMRDRARKFREEQDATLKLIEETKDEIDLLSSELSWLAADIDDLDDTKWDRIRGEKQIRQGGQATHSDFVPPQP